jgi:predicted nucleic acid-binding protein
MALIVDAGAMYAQADADEPRHEAVAQLLRSEPGELVTSELAVAEADYLILDRLGVDVELAFLGDLASGAFQVECLTRAELEQASSVVERHRDLKLGLADASLVVLAARYRTNRIASFDERAFRSVAPLTGGAFIVLPADRS